MSAEPIPEEEVVTHNLTEEQRAETPAMWHPKERRRDGISVTYVKSLYYEDPDPVTALPPRSQEAERLGKQDRFIVDAKNRAIAAGDKTDSIFPEMGTDKEFEERLGRHLLSLTAGTSLLEEETEPPSGQLPDDDPGVS